VYQPRVPSYVKWACLHENNVGFIKKDRGTRPDKDIIARNSNDDIPNLAVYSAACKCVVAGATPRVVVAEKVFVGELKTSIS
jgi:hypothetical protein